MFLPMFVSLFDCRIMQRVQKQFASNLVEKKLEGPEKDQLEFGAYQMKWADPGLLIHFPQHCERRH